MTPIEASNFARRFADELRILLYGDCDLKDQIECLAFILSEYDGVADDASKNKLLIHLNKLEGFRRSVNEALNSGDGTYKP